LGKKVEGEKRRTAEEPAEKIAFSWPSCPTHAPSSLAPFVFLGKTILMVRGLSYTIK
jgi:hypothetical protein